MLIADKSHEQTDKAKDLMGLTPDEEARMEWGIRMLEAYFRMIEGRHVAAVLLLVLACSYLRKLLANAAVNRVLGQRHPGNSRRRAAAARAIRRRANSGRPS